MDQPFELAQVADQLFPNLDLGDPRRDRRFRTVVQEMARKPGQSLPQIFPDVSQYHACLRLFDAPPCSHERICAAHQTAVLDRLKTTDRPILLLHDTTHLDFSGHTTLENDLGQIGNGGGRGWLAHHTLAVDPSNRVVFGLLSQILHVRPQVPKNEPVKQRRERQNRESRLWMAGLDALGPTPPGACWIDVCDRGADTFEFLFELVERQRRFVVRSKFNRALGCTNSQTKATALLHDTMRGLAATSTWDLTLPGRAGQPPRVAHLSAVAQRLTIRPPHVCKGKYVKKSLEMTVVRVWEANPPAGVEALEWLLLTSETVTCEADLRRVADWYACRMQIEEYHKVQKSGLAVEGCQMRTVARVGAYVAITSILAVALMNLRLAARDPAWKDQPATRFVPELWIKVLRIGQGSAALNSRRSELTVAEFWVGLARLGGYQKNPTKHPPGWITLWRGWMKLQLFLEFHEKLARAKL